MPPSAVTYDSTQPSASLIEAHLGVRYRGGYMRAAARGVVDSPGSASSEPIRLDADAFNQLASTGNLLRDAITVLVAAAWWSRRRLGIVEPVWALST
jgi:hypothetical protein